MRIAIIVLGLLLAGTLVVLWRARRDPLRVYEGETQRMQGELDRLAAAYESILERQQEELHKAFDRIQAPEWAVQDSQAERAIKAGAIDPGVTGAVQEMPMSEDMRQRQQAIEEELSEKLRKRGIDPSELQSASAEFRGVDPLGGS